MRTAICPIPFLINVFYAIKGTKFYFLFAFSAVGVVPCDGLKKSPRTSSIVLIIFSFFSDNIMRYEKCMLNLDIFI